MKLGSNRNSWLLFSLSFLSRIPFIFAGYGREEDAWSQALNAREIAETGVYEVSRLPGHPVYELLLSLLWPFNHQYWFFNGLSALVSALSVVLFYRIALKYQLTSPLWLSLGFSFVPVFFIAGTYTIDYNWALLFILLSWYLLQSQKYWQAAAMLGLATGFRISSLAFVVPIILASPHHERRDIWRFAILSFVAGAICYLPPFLRYGSSFFDFHKPPFPGWASIIYKLTLGIWGAPLLLALIALKIGWFRGGNRFSSLARNKEGLRLAGAAVIAWLLCLLVFVRLPFKAEFFIPALPFLFLFLGYLANRLELRTILAAAVLSCFAFGFDYHNSYRGARASKLAFEFSAGDKLLFLDPVQGPVLVDQSKRSNKSALVNEVVSWMEQQPDSTFLIAGWYWPELSLKDPGTTPVITDYYSSAQELRSYHQRGYDIYFLPEINQVNYKINAHYLADSLGQALHPL